MLRHLLHLFLLFQLVSSTCGDFDSQPDIPVDPFPEYDPQSAIVYRYRQKYGVNCGSLYVYEHWMTPSVFACAAGRSASEIDIASGANARAILENHWNNFISESDFSDLANMGINTIRLPIGYWSLGPEFCDRTPFGPLSDVYRNSWAYIVRTINLAAEYGLGVLVDLHGAVGSQNGQPHSGISDHQVGLFNSSSNQQKTLDVLAYLTNQLCTVTNIVGIQILNEPVNDPELPKFYSRAIETMRQTSTCAQTFPLYIHDAFVLEQYSDYVGNRTDFVVQDHHSYFAFTQDDESKSVSQLTEEVATSVADSLDTASAKQRDNLIVGEWSGALTPHSLSLEQDPDEAQRNFSATQMKEYSRTTAGWIFWAYKLENCDTDPGWCFLSAVGNTLPDTFGPYPNGCQLPSRRSLLATISAQRSRRDTSDDPSYDQGYSDGYSAARMFCENPIIPSALGHVRQYIIDGMQSYGPNGVDPDSYSAGFFRGLSDGEADEGR
ncbi:glycoside hydrolase superfamily [Roridomyces roridus]|uniref:Glycoside hydrolase superfamily n=1 Tax=Roridomyces roridus TaxID=1738132 RepID=A0AAD7BW86_9AGAR|nr:glycoside hydrolase superfamily [Roridomyces roridus]